MDKTVIKIGTITLLIIGVIVSYGLGYLHGFVSGHNEGFNEGTTSITGPLFLHCNQTDKESMYIEIPEIPVQSCFGIWNMTNWTPSEERTYHEGDTFVPV